MERDDPARERLFLLTFAVTALFVAIVDALSMTDDRARAGQPLSIAEPLVWETTSIVMMLVLLPAVLALTRRLPPLAAPWTRVIPAHALGAGAFSLAHVVGMGAMRWAIYAVAGGFYSPIAPLRDFPYEVRKDLLAYVGTVAVYVAWRRLGGPVEHGKAAPERDVLEVRDGARRHFVPLDAVTYVEAAGNYVELDGPAGPILHRASLSSLEGRLQDAGFVRIHRSRLVRRSMVAAVDSRPSGDFVVRLVDGRELAGSRRFRRPLLDA